MEINLSVVGGKAKTRQVAVTLPAVIGRSREADLAIAHATISRRHCRLYEVDGLVHVEDLGSLNGILVEGRTVAEATLRPKDQFTVGPITFRVDYDYSAGTTAAGLKAAAAENPPQPDDNDIGLAPEEPTISPKKR